MFYYKMLLSCNCNFNLEFKKKILPLKTMMKIYLNDLFIILFVRYQKLHFNIFNFILNSSDFKILWLDFFWSFIFLGLLFLFRSIGFLDVFFSFAIRINITDSGMMRNKLAGSVLIQSFSWS